MAEESATCIAECEIRRVLARYCRAVDRRDRDLLASCYHEGATDRHGPYTGSATGFVDYCIEELDARAASHGQVTTHLLGQSIIDLDGEAARVETYFTSNHVEDREEAFRVFEFHGRYLDRFALRSGAWRIDRRVVIHDWSDIRMTRRGLRRGDYAYVQGAGWPDDPVYDANDGGLA